MLWKTREETLRIAIHKQIIISKVTEHINYIKNFPNNRLEKPLDELSRLDLSNLINL